MFKVIPAAVLFAALSMTAVAAENGKTDGYEAPRGAQPDHHPETGTVNGIRFADYKDFEKNWKLATVTYRTDVSEMRLSYANDRAYKTLLAGHTNYPDGAVFIKVAALTMGDPAFINSKLPSRVDRYQVMVRDAKRYATTDGWGYAYFDTRGWNNRIISWNGMNVPDNITEMEKKCHACHSLVKDRNYVFSKLMNTEENEAHGAAFFDHTDTDGKVPGLTFKTETRASLPEQLRQLVPDNHKNVQRLTGALSEFAFIGIAYELRPSLIAEAARSKQPVIYYKPEGGSMLLVAPTDRAHEPVAPSCAPGEELFVSYWVIGAETGSWPTKDLFCVRAE